MTFPCMVLSEVHFINEVLRPPGCGLSDLCVCYENMCQTFLGELVVVATRQVSRGRDIFLVSLPHISMRIKEEGRQTQLHHAGFK